MASSAIPIPKDATIGESTSAPQRGDFTAANGVNYIPRDAQVQNEGEIVNDVGNKVIVPKEGESFADTMKRAIQYHDSLTPEQRQAAINKEVGTMPKKAAEALGGAAVAGIAGPAALAGAGEAGAAIQGLTTAPLGMTPPIIRALPHIVQFAKVMGQLGVGVGGLSLLLKELMGDSKK
jgi:hypothetical protein